MPHPAIGETFSLPETGFWFTCTGHYENGEPIPGHPCGPIGKAPRTTVVKPDGTKETKQFPVPPPVEKPAKAPQRPVAQPATTVPSTPRIAAPRRKQRPLRAPRRYNRYARRQPVKIEIPPEPMSAGKRLFIVVSLALTAAIIWGLVVHDGNVSRQSLIDCERAVGHH